MRLKVIACKVFEREFAMFVARSPHFIDTTFLRQGLHNEPAKLQAVLQAEIDRIDSGDDLHTCEENETLGNFDAILIGYGLCSNGVVNVSSKKHRLVIPKAHDCLTMFLGSKEAYREYFDKMSGGIYWYTPGWIENTIMPGHDRYQLLYKQYAEKYGEDNAEYLMEMEQGWLKEYKVCAYVDWNCLSFPNHIEYTKQCADYLGWQCDILQGDPKLIDDFLNGNWRDDAFVVAQPGEKLVQSFDEQVIKVGAGLCSARADNCE